jgi:hypothetical protein
MNLKEKLKDLIDELDRIHPDGFLDLHAWHVADDFPDFVTAQNGQQRHFSKTARESLRVVAAILYENDPGISSVIGLNELETLIRQSVADLHAG